ncbi:unnamed protein product [Scytosiphon promiscuus]
MKRSRAAAKGNPVGYAKRLETGHHKGRCGGAEVELPPRKVAAEAKRLAELLKGASFVVVHTGAGLSTAAGIPDFRGKDGVWTLEEQGEPLPDYEKCWDNAMPTLGHMALVGLVKEGLVHAIISQNLSWWRVLLYAGLHLRSGIPREKLCELHGNLFMEVCSGCQREFRRTADVGGVGFKPTAGRRCPQCGEGLVDALLDWEDELRDYEQAVELSNRQGGVSLCLGTSLQIAPSKDLPAKAENMAIVNLQKTPKDARAAIVIRAKIDAVMRCVMRELRVPFPVYRRVETLVISHTSCVTAGKGDRWKWSLAVGDAADGARCGYVESIAVSFPGTKLSDAQKESPPFRVSRTTKSRRPPEGKLVLRSERKGAGEVGGPTSNNDNWRNVDREVAGREDGIDVKVDVDRACSVGVDVYSGLGPDGSCAVGVACGTGDVRADGLGVDRSCKGEGGGFVSDRSVNGGVGGCGSGGEDDSEVVTSVLRLSFVAAPGRAAPLPQTVEYRIDLSKSAGSREIAVFLGEVDYNE